MFQLNVSYCTWENSETTKASFWGSLEIFLKQTSSSQKKCWKLYKTAIVVKLDSCPAPYFAFVQKLPGLREGIL